MATDGVITPSPRILKLRQNAQRGGLKTAALMTEQQLFDRSSKAGRTVLAMYGREIFRVLNHRRKDNNRKGWRKGRSRKAGVTN